jgi:hypothetical protein
MPSLKQRFANGDAIEYDSSIPLSEYNIIPDGFELDQIYVVKIPAKVQAKVKSSKPIAIVRDAYSPNDIFDYGERIPAGHQVVQALRNIKTDKLVFRLLTGVGPVYGRVVFTSPNYVYTRHVRSRQQFEAYKNATDIVNQTSPGPHRLESRVENDDTVTYTFKKFDGTLRQIQYIRETSK